MTIGAQIDVRRMSVWSVIALVCGVIVATLPPTASAVLIGGATGLLAIVLRPIIGLAIALFVGSFAAWEAVFVGGIFGRFSSGQLIFFLTLTAWFVQMFADRSVHIPQTPLNKALFVFIAITALTLWTTSSVWDGLKEIGKWVEVTLVLWLIIDTGRRWTTKDASKKHNCSAYARLIVFILLLGALFQGLLGIWQYALRGDGPDHFLISEGLYRASGTFQQPNPFGGFMSMMLSLAVGTTIGLLLALWFKWRQTRRWRTIPVQTWLWLGFLLIACSVLLGALLGSWSRGAWLNFAAGMATLAFFLPRKRRYGFLLVLAGCVAILVMWQLGVIPASVWERLTGFVGDFQLADVRGVDINDANFAVIERLAHWQSALGMAREKLWLGVGFGNYEAVYSTYALVNWPAALGHAHNYYLNLLAETGVFGLLAYIGLWLVIVWQTIRLLALRSWEARGMALGLLAAWIGMAIHHLLDNLYVNNLYLQLGTMLGLVVWLQSYMPRLKEPKHV